MPIPTFPSRSLAHSGLNREPAVGWRTSTATRTTGAFGYTSRSDIAEMRPTQKPKEQPFEQLYFSARRRRLSGPASRLPLALAAAGWASSQGQVGVQSSSGMAVTASRPIDGR